MSSWRFTGRGGPCFATRSGQTSLAAKRVREVGGVAESCAVCDFGDREIAPFEQPLGQFEALAQYFLADGGVQAPVRRAATRKPATRPRRLRVGGRTRQSRGASRHIAK